MASVLSRCLLLLPSPVRRVPGRICCADSSLVSSLAARIPDPPRRDEAVKIIGFLLSRGCTRRDIEERCLPWIGGTHSSHVKALLIADLDPDLASLMPLMSVPLPSLRRAAKQARADREALAHFPGRIRFLAHHLEVGRDGLAPHLARHCALLTMRLARLEHKLNILKSAPIDPEHILKDLWIFNYNEKLLLSRVHAAKKSAVDLKPWMLRCSEKIFESVLVKYQEANKVLKGEDEICFLARRLDCSTQYVEFLIMKNKFLAATNVPKLDQIITFLYENGYTPEEVRLFPRIFCCNIDTLYKSLEEHRKLKSAVPTLSQLCKSVRQLSKSESITSSS